MPYNRSQALERDVHSVKIVPEIIYIFVSLGENYYPRLEISLYIFIYHYIFVHVIVYSGTVFGVREEGKKIINDDERDI